MEQGETAAGTVSPAAAAVVRQLDFTVNFKAVENGHARGSMILPEHPQAQLQSKLLALAQSKQAQAPPSCQSPPRTAAAAPPQQQQTKLPPRKMVMPPKSPQRELPPMPPPPAKSPAAPANKAPPPKPALQPFMKAESPKAREKCNLEPNDGTPKKQKQCNCKNSRCLKLYCECFASGVYCDGCNCINCHNKIEHEADRKGSIDAILERNPNAFRPKIASSPHGVTDGGVEHNKGCNCKKSGCLKRYCECFQANILCSDKCKCMDCKNFEGSEERKAHFNQYPSNSIAVLQQAANAAINGAIGSPSKKSKNQQIVFGMTTNKQASWPPQFHQEKCSTSDASKFPFSLNPSKQDAALIGISKPSYRSPLGGILQLRDVKDLCTLLVEVSAEAAQNFSTEDKNLGNYTDVAGAKLSSVSSSHEDNKDDQNQGKGDSDDFGIRDGRPLSPATLALMCDEQDTMFMEVKAPSTTTESNIAANTKPKSTHDLDQLYIEQERLVLNSFRSFLNRIITCGSIEERKVEQEIE